jgi:membrane protein involved in colicin uptake
MSDGTTSTPDGGTPDGEATTGTPPAETGSGDDLEQVKADAERWKALARKHEDRAKANASAAKELEELRKQSMSETERAVAEARAEARRDAMRELGSRVVDAEVRAAAKGRVADVDALLEGLDRSKFLNDDGDADAAAISKWIDRIAPAAGDTDDQGDPFPDIGQGARGGDSAGLGSDPLLQTLKNSVGAR